MVISMDMTDKISFPHTFLASQGLENSRRAIIQQVCLFLVATSQCAECLQASLMHPSRRLFDCITLCLDTRAPAAMETVKHDAYNEAAALSCEYLLMRRGMERTSISRHGHAAILGSAL
nr:hypothetical protein CFP56_09293 [Quercus suber]